ncbi:EGF-like repeat and discoidin I-like domain-containing protein 3 [Nematostella vectensis]|uniref:EGF-like repeat and discoidin I-like domain-containing protein 3 n=1 Tax=Nematostella vectensis TaxID=45351 RepID=UPI0020773542|nr:EGF-like repeat and discoidin I-like domain-containing protein 3 [Nematostella vectensis]
MTCIELKGNPKYRCECPQGYTGAACETDIDECSSGSNNCHQEATYVNECSSGSINCHRDHASCANTIGSFACTCKPGYTGDGINCADCAMGAMGMESGAISDSAITASSYVDNTFTTLLPSYGCLNHEKAWVSGPKSPGEYLQIDLGRVTTVTKVATQGNPNWPEEGTKSYKIRYSTDLSTWKLYREGGQEKVFPGNTNRNTVVYGVLAQPIVARGIRIIAVTFKWRPALRVEVYECM